MHTNASQAALLVTTSCVPMIGRQLNNFFSNRRLPHLIDGADTQIDTAKGSHRLEISVDHSKAVQMRDGKNHLGSIETGQLLIKDSLRAQPP